jgi:hypothetical protein
MTKVQRLWHSQQHMNILCLFLAVDVACKVELWICPSTSDRSKITAHNALQKHIATKVQQTGNMAMHITFES